MSGPQCIAIDGPAGSGKSTIGEKLAHQLGYLYVDTGAMYRAVAWLALRKHVDLHDGVVLGELAQRAEIVISHPHVPDGRQYTVTVHDYDLTWDIRSSAVTGAVSVVSAHPEVRRVLIAQQREMARQGQVVMVGRDIGAVVLPDAELKIYLTASLAERARRRHAELVARLGENSSEVPSLSEIEKDIARRDDIDHDNMRPAIDAIVIETDYLSVQQVLDAIAPYVEDTTV
jgi:cytidylate kinase